MVDRLVGRGQIGQRVTQALASERRRLGQQLAQHLGADLARVGRLQRPLEIDRLQHAAVALHAHQDRVGVGLAVRLDLGRQAPARPARTSARFGRYGLAVRPGPLDAKQRSRQRAPSVSHCRPICSLAPPQSPIRQSWRPSSGERGEIGRRPGGGPAGAAPRCTARRSTCRPRSCIPVPRLDDSPECTRRS